MSVMFVDPLPQKMMTHHYTLSMGDKWGSYFDTGGSMYMINERHVLTSIVE